MTLYAGVTAKRLLPADWYLSHMLKLPRSFAGAQYDKWEAGRIARNADYKTHRPLKGKRLTTFCASPALLQNVFAVHRRAIPPPSGPKAPSNLRTLRPIGPVNLKNLPLLNLHTEGVSKGKICSHISPPDHFRHVPDQ